MLTPIEGSTRHVSNLGVGNAPLPAQVSFNPAGDMLAVTERSGNMIDSYAVDENGVAWGPMSIASAGMTPYGFAFTPGGTLVVSEAFGGSKNGSAVSSYSLITDTLVVDSASVSTTQTAACWIAVSLDGKYAYAANAGSSSISSYSVADDGTLTLLDAAAGMTGDGTAPVDLSMSSDGQYLYVLSAKSQNVIAFAVQADGSLEMVDAFGGLPKGAGGIAVR
jgi:6-phosphogluconolactonase (cycloisomerase 2 family)